MNFWNFVSKIFGWASQRPAPPAYAVGSNTNPWHEVMASSFADPADVEAYRRAKLRGATDQEAFRVGDNGIGKWGDDTTGPIPGCALPPEDWRHLAKPRWTLVDVQVGNRTVTCELRDTMPKRKNIENGAGIDLNPAACAALGLKPPVMVKARWRWH